VARGSVSYPMPDIKFACPHCQQHIQAEQGYAGMQIACPACKGNLLVPGTPAAPAPAPPPMPAVTSAPAPSSAAGCPSCGAPLPRGAVLCTTCGYNLATKQRTVAGRPAALGKPTAPKYDAPWYKTAYPYIGFVLVVLGVLYFLGRENPGIMLAFLGVAVLYTLTAHIIVIVAAFKESVGTGFLTMCIPFYALYFVFKVNDSDTLKLIYAVAVIINISLRFLAK
jgi:DNA-directed RNA polymerase subunit RPC12/RpoP